MTIHQKAKKLGIDLNKATVSDLLNKIESSRKDLKSCQTSKAKEGASVGCPCPVDTSTTPKKGAKAKKSAK